jgi:hypothetical protein
MSANPKPDLEQVKSKFESFRARRVRKERLPENLWAEAVNLLDHYPFDIVWRQLRLKPNYLRKRAAAAKGLPTQPVEKKPKFLALSAHELRAIKNGNNALPTTTDCRLVIERTDGSRLTLNLPIDGFSQTDWLRIEALCTSFLRG